MFENQTERNLLPAPGAQFPVPAESLRAPWRGSEIELEDSGVPLSHYLWILRRHRWKIISFIFVCVAATLIVSSRITPIYESTASVDVDRQMPLGIIGQEANNAPNDTEQFLATQVRLIQSDSVVRPVAQRYKLLALESVSSNADPARSPSEEAPMFLSNLKVARPPGTLLLLISYRSPDPRLSADVANAITRSYLEHTYNIRSRSSASLSEFMEKQIEELKAKMERSSAALAKFERELNVINPEEKTSILTARLLQLNTEYTNAQGDRVRKEATWRSVGEGTLAAAQVSTQGEALKRIAERLDEAHQKLAEVQMHYGANHPEYRKAITQLTEVQGQLQQGRENAAQRVYVEYREAMNREAMLQKAVAQTKAEFDHINARSFEYQAFKREAEGDKKIYEELVRKIKEAGINAGFQNGAIRIADAARPSVRPVSPRIKVNVVVAFALSTLLALGVAVLSDTLDNTLRDPEQIGSLLNTEVIGSLPLVKPSAKKLLAVLPDRDRVASEDGWLNGFEEAVGTLRNTIILGSFGCQIRSLMVTSASPSEGKTTSAVRLALAHALQKHKTLLIDADMRRPAVGRSLGITADEGLASALSNGLKWKDNLLKVDQIPYLDVLATRTTNRRAADLIGSALPKILDEAARWYDLVIVDVPPMLGFPEPLQMAVAVDGVVVIARAGKTNRKAVGAALNMLQRVRANVLGVVLNAVTSRTSESYTYFGHYGKYYKYGKPGVGT
jgi:succinoglycan biosynthesis transport protein ExoP